MRFNISTVCFAFSMMLTLVAAKRYTGTVESFNKSTDTGRIIATVNNSPAYYLNFIPSKYNGCKPLSVGQTVKIDKLGGCKPLTVGQTVEFDQVGPGAPRAENVVPVQK